MHLALAIALTAPTFSFRQLMAQEPLEKLGFGDLTGGKSEAKTQV